MADFENTAIVLSDEDGNEFEVEIIETLEHEGKIYVAMVEVFDNPEDMLSDNGEFFIFEIIEDDEGVGFCPVEDEELLNTLGDKFEEIFNTYDDCDDDCDCGCDHHHES